MKKGRQWPVDQIRKWSLEGRSLKWIGDQLGSYPQLIYLVCKRNQIQTNKVGPGCGEKHAGWKGGRVVDKNGYILLYCPDHPNVWKMGRKKSPYILEHRLIMERHLGRLLERNEVVHHINGVNDDNRIENLQLFQSNSEHMRHELTGKCPQWTLDGLEKRKASFAERRGGKLHTIPREHLEFYFLKCGWSITAIAKHLHYDDGNIRWWLSHYKILITGRRSSISLTPLGVHQLLYSPRALGAYARRCKRLYPHLKKLLDTVRQPLSEKDFLLWQLQVSPHSTRIQRRVLESLRQPAVS